MCHIAYLIVFPDAIEVHKVEVTGKLFVLFVRVTAAIIVPIVNQLKPSDRQVTDKNGGS